MLEDLNQTLLTQYISETITSYVIQPDDPSGPLRTLRGHRMKRSLYEFAYNYQYRQQKGYFGFYTIDRFLTNYLFEEISDLYNSYLRLDYFGPNLESFQNITTTATRLYLDYLHLPDNYPVTIVGEPDALCRSCNLHSQSHCLTDWTTTQHDHDMMNTLIKKGLYFSYETTNHGNGHVQEYRAKVLTNLGNIRRYIDSTISIR